MANQRQRVGVTPQVVRRPLQEVRDALDQEVSVFEVGEQEVHLVLGADGDGTGEDAAAVGLLHDGHLGSRAARVRGSDRRTPADLDLGAGLLYLSEGDDELTQILLSAVEADVVVGDEQLADHVHLGERRPQRTVRVSVQTLVLRQPKHRPVSLVLRPRIKVPVATTGSGSKQETVNKSLQPDGFFACLVWL